MATHLEILRAAYERVKERGKSNLRSEDTASSILDLTLASIKFLSSSCLQVSLKSLVPGKEYISFATKDNPAALARPANRALFTLDEELVKDGWLSWVTASPADRKQLGKMVYTVALAPCLAFELFDRQNKKAPATYFEVLIGHLFARALGTNPDTKVSLPVCGKNMRMTMDYLFEEHANRPKIHLPVKMSTRERVVQAWAHQRVLDAAYGEGIYRGIMVLFAETKLSLKTREVVEICVPDQWIIYQSLLSKMKRIYYFDMPDRYGALTKTHPNLIEIKRFDEFFGEIGEVLRR
jgi:hypothetical protein